MGQFIGFGLLVEAPYMDPDVAGVPLQPAAELVQGGVQAVVAVVDQGLVELVPEGDADLVEHRVGPAMPPPVHAAYLEVERLVTSAA